MPCETLAYLQPRHIPSPGIFRTGDIFKILRNFGQVSSELFHTQPAITCSKLAIETLLQGVKYVQS